MAIYMWRDGTPVTWVSVSPTSISITALNGTSQLTATVTPSNATNSWVTWSSSNTAVATVDNSWLVTRVAYWSATITVTTNDGWYTATCSLANWAWCFLKWAPILTKDWYKNIEDITVWDVVLSFNEEIWEIESNTVIDFIKHPYNWIMVKLNWWVIEATANHPVYTSKDKENREYKLIWDIEIWEWIYSKDWYIEVLEKEEREYSWDVYNFTVDKTHNYFVFGGVLVHNASTGGW